MTGQEEAEIIDQTVTPPEDPRLDQYTGQIFKKFSEVFSEFTPEQFKKALALSEELAKDKIKTEDSADNDQLTDLPTRKGFYKQFDRILLQRYRDSKTGRSVPISIFYFDIDDFKVVNEKYKHQKGDEVLSAIGQYIKNSIRPTDIAGRIGGEEFAIILDDTSLEGAITVAERHRIDTLDMLNTVFSELDWSKTISGGVYQLPNLTPEQLASENDRMNIILQAIHLADTAQSDGAKHIGKNRIGVMLPDGTVQTATVNINTIENQPSMVAG